MRNSAGCKRFDYVAEDARLDSLVIRPSGGCVQWLFDLRVISVFLNGPMVQW